MIDRARDVFGHENKKNTLTRFANISNQIQKAYETIEGLKSEMKEATKENQLLKQSLSEYENKYYHISDAIRTPIKNFASSG